MTWQRAFHIISTAPPEVWTAILILGILGVLIDIYLFHAGILKLRLCFRTHSLFDGFFGAGVLLIASAFAQAAISLGVAQFSPKTPLLSLPARALSLVDFHGGLILLTVLRPRTKFGKPAAGMQTESNDEL